MHQQPSCAYAFGLFFYYWRLEGFVLVFKEVEGFCFCSWRLKGFVLVLKRFLKRVKGFVFALGG
jgi:hypothetical protein